jgi:DNA-binding response OmpR family regulator
MVSDKQPLVLVIDDEDDIADSIADVLRPIGYEVETRPDGAAGLSVAGARPVSLVLLDWRLSSEPSGAVLVEGLRHACGGTVPVVVISADPSSLAEAREAAVADYLPKPFDIDDLVGLVDDYCR